MPPSWAQTGVPGFVAFTHFHSSTISGSASLMIPRTLLSVWPRQSPSSPILLSISLEAFVSSFAIWISYAVERSSGEAHAGTRDGIGRYYRRRFEPPAVPGGALSKPEAAAGRRPPPCVADGYERQPSTAM